MFHILLFGVLLLALCLESSGLVARRDVNAVRNQFNIGRKVFESNFPRTVGNRLFLIKNYDPESEDENGNTFTRKQILKEETEAPFRKVRIFFYISLLAAAGLGTIITITKLLASFTLARSVESLPDLYINLAINLGGIIVLSYLWKRDLDEQSRLLNRIQKGGSLAGLKIKYPTASGLLTVKLSDLRRDRGIDKRVIIVVAPKDLLLKSLQSSIPQNLSIIQNDLIIVPVMIEPNDASRDYTMMAPSLDGLLLPDDTPGKLEDNLFHIGLPTSLSNWKEVLKKEIGTALTQDADALEKGIHWIDQVSHS